MCACVFLVVVQYVSCNARSMLPALDRLSDQFVVRRFALLDLFPYTGAWVPAHKVVSAFVDRHRATACASPLPT